MVRSANQTIRTVAVLISLMALLLLAVSCENRADRTDVPLAATATNEPIARPTDKATTSPSSTAPTTSPPADTVPASTPTREASGIATPTRAARPASNACTTTLCCPDCEIVTVVEVIDGDTIRTPDSTIRVYGIDSPEYCVRCYTDAKARLVSLVGESVRTKPGERQQDSFGRQLVYLYTLDGESIDEIMLAEGLAVAWNADGNALDELLSAEEKARESGTGCVWDLEADSDKFPAPADTSASGVGEQPQLKVERVWSWLEINDPLFMTSVPGWESCNAFVSQDGLILVTADAPTASQGFARPLLDIRNRVSRAGNEEGLLGLAFHPDFASNGRFFVYYSAADPRRSVISEFIADPVGKVDRAAEWVLLEVRQPFPNHKGGMLAFGPDGYLYIGLGDGGSSGDPQGHGQDTATLLGSILRIDVDSQAPGLEYGIPADNPFARLGGAPEIWAYGLRNPWRFSFDHLTGDLWAGDVGQSALEEIDIILKGGNYGWNIMEASRCYKPATGCGTQGLILPVAAYGRADGCSVTGGYVYRGDRVRSLYGAYLYGDYCTGNIWAIRRNGETFAGPVLVSRTDLEITSFGEGEDGDIYILDRRGGIYRFAE